MFRPHRIGARAAYTRRSNHGRGYMHVGSAILLSGQFGGKQETCLLQAWPRARGRCAAWRWPHRCQAARPRSPRCSQTSGCGWWPPRRAPPPCARPPGMARAPPGRGVPGRWRAPAACLPHAQLLLPGQDASASTWQGRAACTASLTKPWLKPLIVNGEQVAACLQQAACVSHLGRHIHSASLIRAST